MNLKCFTDFLSEHSTALVSIGGYVVFAATSALHNPWDGLYPTFYRFIQNLSPLEKRAADKVPALQASKTPENGKEN